MATLTPICLLAGATPLTAKTGPCDAADRFQALGLLAHARSAYLELLDTKPPPDCARPGFEKVTAEQRRAADMLKAGKDHEALKDYGAALSAYVQAITIDRSLSDAVAALEALVEKLQGDPEDTTDPFAAAHALLAAGYEEAAREEAKRVVKEDSPGKPIPPSLSSPAGWGRLTFVGGVVRDWAIALVPLVVIILLAFLALARSSWVRSKLFPWTKMFRPRFKIDDFGDPSEALKIGKTLSAKLAEEIREGDPDTLERITGTESDPELPEFDLGPQLKFVGPLINLLFRPHWLNVSGQAHCPSAAQVGLSVVIAERGKTVKESSAFIGKGGTDDKDVQPFFDLIPRVGAWSVFALRRATSYSEPLTIVGTQNWESYQYFREGVAMHQQNRRELARSAYLKAVELDSKNWGALINLAQLDMRNPKAYDRAIERLGRARKEIDGDPAKHLKPYWYTITNLLAVTRLHQFTEGKGDNETRTKQLEDSRREAATLVMQIATSLLDLTDGSEIKRLLLRKQLKTERRIDSERRLKVQEEFLRRAEDQAITILLSAQLEAENRELLIEDPARPVPRTSPERWTRLSALDVERPPTADKLMESLGGERILDHRAQYNVACYLARAGKFDESLNALEKALEGNRMLIDWAEQDPSLKELRESADHASTFRDRIERAREEAAPPKLPNAAEQTTEAVVSKQEERKGEH